MSERKECIHGSMRSVGTNTKAYTLTLLLREILDISSESHKVFSSKGYTESTSGREGRGKEGGGEDGERKRQKERDKGQRTQGEQYSHKIFLQRVMQTTPASSNSDSHTCM